MVVREGAGLRTATIGLLLLVGILVAGRLRVMVSSSSSTSSRSSIPSNMVPFTLVPPRRKMVVSSQLSLLNKSLLCALMPLRVIVDSPQDNRLLSAGKGVRSFESK